MKKILFLYIIHLGFALQPIQIHPPAAKAPNAVWDRDKRKNPSDSPLFLHDLDSWILYHKNGRKKSDEICHFTNSL